MHLLVQFYAPLVVLVASMFNIFNLRSKPGYFVSGRRLLLYGENKEKTTEKIMFGIGALVF